MRASVYRTTRTGLIVLKLSGGDVPRIGTTVRSENFVGKIVDVIGPVVEPFLVVKPLKGKVSDKVELQIVKKRKRR